MARVRYYYYYYYYYYYSKESKIILRTVCHSKCCCSRFRDISAVGMLTARFTLLYLRSMPQTADITATRRDAFPSLYCFLDSSNLIYYFMPETASNTVASDQSLSLVVIAYVMVFCTGLIVRTLTL
jgi:hypothetical protein